MKPDGFGSVTYESFSEMRHCRALLLNKGRSALEAYLRSELKRLYPIRYNNLPEGDEIHIAGLNNHTEFLLS